MKFPQLEIGQRFEFEGKVYVKVGPVAAQEEATGEPRMIPRYAVLKPLGERARPSGSGEPRAVSAEAVVSAFGHFYEECLDILGPSAEAAALARLKAARQRFLDAL